MRRKKGKGLKWGRLEVRKGYKHLVIVNEVMKKRSVLKSHVHPA